MCCGEHRTPHGRQRQGRRSATGRFSGGRDEEEGQRAGADEGIGNRAEEEAESAATAVGREGDVGRRGFAGDADGGGGDRFEGARGLHAAMDHLDAGHGGLELFEGAGEFEFTFAGGFAEGGDGDGKQFDRDSGAGEQAREAGADRGGRGAPVGEGEDPDRGRAAGFEAGTDREDGHGSGPDGFAEAGEAGALPGVDGEETCIELDGAADGRGPLGFAVETEGEAGGLDAGGEHRLEVGGRGADGGDEFSGAGRVGARGGVEDGGAEERQAKRVGERPGGRGEGVEVGEGKCAKESHGASMAELRRIREGRMAVAIGDVAGICCGMGRVLR